MLIRKHANQNYTITLTLEEESLFQQEVNSDPYFGITDIASLIGFNLLCELKVLKGRYTK